MATATTVHGEDAKPGNALTGKGMDFSAIEALLGKSRTRNAYGPKLVELCESDEAGVDVQEAWPIEFGQKISSTLYQGFNTAIKKAKLEDTLELRQSDGHVFILHKERVRLATQAASTNGNNSTVK